MIDINVASADRATRLRAAISDMRTRYAGPLALMRGSNLLLQEIDRYIGEVESRLARLEAAQPDRKVIEAGAQLVRTAAREGRL